MIVDTYREEKRCRKCHKWARVGKEWTDTLLPQSRVGYAWSIFLCEKCLVKAGHKVRYGA